LDVGRRGYLLWAASAVAIGISLALHWRFGVETLGRVSTPSMDVHGDFEAFWWSARSWLAGGDVYETGTRLTNLNPPLWVPLFAPLALLEPLPAYRVFTVVSATLALAALGWMALEARLARGIGSFWAALAVGALFVSSPMLATLALGQIYAVLTFLLVASWAAERRGREVLSGVLLGLVVALKPTLAPVLLWPAARRGWKALVAAVLSGAGATIAAFVVVGPGATFGWVEVIRQVRVSPYWDNASLPAMAARLFTIHERGEPLAVVPEAVVVATVLGAGLVLLTARLVRHGRGDGRGAEGGLWALAAVALVASPIAWHNYLVLLAPGAILLLARGRIAAGVLLVSLQLIPAQWPRLWAEAAQNGHLDSTVSLFPMSLYFPILLAHWTAFLVLSREGGPKEGASLRPG